MNTPGLPQCAMALPTKHAGIEHRPLRDRHERAWDKGLTNHDRGGQRTARPAFKSGSCSQRKRKSGLKLSAITLSMLIGFSACTALSQTVATNHLPVDLNTPRTFPEISSAQQWEQRAKEIRQQVLVSCGLWPLPEKTPLKPHIFGKVERDGYSIEKVYFETWPGLYLGGNLYRPLGRGRGPFPAILNPHGHWSNGRMADTKDGSIAGRCISFARQGMIAFSYDMIGYNDTHFADAPQDESFSDLHHQIATNRADLLWNISLMGLQTWNSIRALDFLESLPDADPKRLACTGESGGGTQTFMLGSVENRLAVQAPVVMVSHIMQGGCLCENAPGLRVEYSNMEIAAAPAPRPQILVAASGDWTKDTPTVEGPSIAHIYQLLKHPESFHYVRFNFDHNYNQTSREAVYGWFGKWLLHAPDPGAIKEKPFQKDADSELRVFPSNHLPEGALTLPQFLQSIRQLHRHELESLVPKDASGVKQFQSVMMPAWRHTLQLDGPNIRPEVKTGKMEACGEFKRLPVTIHRPGQEGTIVAGYWAPPGILETAVPRLVVMVSKEPDPLPASNSAPSGPILSFLKNGLAVLQVHQFSSGHTPDLFKEFYTTYNRTELQNHVADLLALCSAGRSVEPRKNLSFRIMLAGTGRAGLWALLAAPGADAVIADCDSLDLSDETTLLAPDLFCPGILAMGGFETAAMLAAPHPLLLHNTGPNFPTKTLLAAYSASGVLGKVRIDVGTLPYTEIAQSAAHF